MRNGRRHDTQAVGPLNAKTDIGQDGNPTLTSGGAGKRHVAVVRALDCKKSLLMAIGSRQS